MTHQTLTQIEFAKHIGVQKSYVTALKKAGRLVFSDNGQVDVAASLARIAATKSPDKQGVADRHAQGRGAELPAGDVVEDEGEGAPEATGNPDYQRARARREDANAGLAEIALREKAGSLMEAAHVESAVADAGVSFRMGLEGMGAMLAPQLAGMSDEASIRQLIDDYTEHLLRELSHRMAQAGKVGQ
jgi:hypothetical protein